jgi:hypothetical protein
LDTPVRLSVSQLADLAECPCDRCYWTSYHLPVPLPSPFPRLLGDLDRETKRAVVRHVRRYGRLPDWHPAVGDVRSVVPAERLRPSVMRVLDRRTGVLLRGSPDMVFQLADGSYHIVDYKATRAPAAGQPTVARYRVQLNAYAFLAEHAGLRPVSGLSLVFLEAGRLLRAREGGFAALRLDARRRRVGLHPDRWVAPLLQRASRVLRRPEPPAAHPDCTACAELASWARKLLRACR